MKGKKKANTGNLSSPSSSICLIDGRVMHQPNLIFSLFVPITLFFQLLPFGLILLPVSSEASTLTNTKITSSTKLLLSESLLLPIPSTTYQEDTFILNLLSQESFSHCSLAILQDRFDNGASVDRILQSVSSTLSSAPLGMKSAYSIKYTFPDPSSLQSFETRLKEMKLKLANKRHNVTDALMSSDSLPVRFPISVSNYRRKSDPCLIVILMVNDIRPEFVKQIYNMLTPVYIPITRKDEDFYIFKTDPDLHQSLLLMQELPNRIKFKIAVGSLDKGDYSKSEKVAAVAVKIRTVCFFCNPGGNPRLLDLPVTAQNLPRDDTDYFPDFVSNLNGKLLHVSLPYIRAKIEADPPWQGTSNARRGNWKMLFEKFLTVIIYNFTFSSLLDKIFIL